MKRRFLSLILIVVLASLVVAGCATDDADEVDEEGGVTPEEESGSVGELQDGHYLAKLPVSEQDNFPLATMEVEDGEIVDFEYVEILADSGEEKSSDNYDYEEGLEVIEDLNEQFNDKKNIDEVDFDAVSGATSTKDNFKEIVSVLLEKAENGETYEAVYEDGEYEAVADEDSHGWLPEVKIVVRDGEIVGVDFHDVAIEDMEGEKAVFDEDNEPVMDGDEPETEPVEIKEGDIKSTENYSYLPAFDTIKAVRKEIIDNNGIEDLDLDAITGATNTKDTMIDLVTKALEEAQ